MKTYKTAKVLKPYSLKAFGYELTVPVGALVSNRTAGGPDDGYRFWVDFKAEAERITGYKNSILAHNLTYYGVNVPADHCEAYQS
jgi:hypothetical protein